jgi:hypothetical protein
VTGGYEVGHRNDDDPERQIDHCGNGNRAGLFTAPLPGAHGDLQVLAQIGLVNWRLNLAASHSTMSSDQKSRRKSIGRWYRDGDISVRPAAVWAVSKLDIGGDDRQFHPDRQLMDIAGFTLTPATVHGPIAV